jgi:glycerol-3-phosphate cytidylyltransferase
LKKSYIIGFTSGVYDLFHIGHLNILKSAKSMCDKLIVGVSTDDLVQTYKHKVPVIPFTERLEIVRSIKFVDSVVAQENMDKMVLWEKLKYDIMFVGDDWQKTIKWKEIEIKFEIVGVKIVYFPYTEGTSSTKINNILDDYRK